MPSADTCCHFCLKKAEMRRVLAPVRMCVCMRLCPPVRAGALRTSYAVHISGTEGLYLFGRHVIAVVLRSAALTGSVACAIADVVLQRLRRHKSAAAHTFFFLALDRYLRPGAALDSWFTHRTGGSRHTHTCSHTGTHKHGGCAGGSKRGLKRATCTWARCWCTIPILFAISSILDSLIISLASFTKPFRRA